MQDFEFYNPTRIVFGKNASDKIGEEAAKLGKKALFVYGKSSIKKSGLYNRVVSMLEKNNVEIVEYNGVQPNPLLSHTNNGIQLAKAANPDFILAVGGGSVLDESKAIAAGTCYDGDVWDFFSGAAVIEKALPILCVMTLPATGSEMNGGMVLTHDETRQKTGFFSPHVHPYVSILDPVLTLTIPKNYTMYGIFDAMSHLLEGYLTHTEDWAPVQERYVEGLVKTLMECADRLLEDPENYDTRANVMWSATLAWNGIGIAGLGGNSAPSHLTSHPISAIFDLAHGAGLAILKPAWMQYALERGNKNVVRFSRNIMGVEDANDDAAGEKGIRDFKAWIHSIGCPVSLSEVGVTESDFPKLSENGEILAKSWGYEGFDKTVFETIYRLCV